MPLRVKLSGDEVGRLIAQLQGLTLFEVKKILTKVVVEDGHFTADDIPKIVEAKRDVINASGVLEYYSTEESMDEVAGLTQLKDWLHKRKAAFSEPDRARAFGLSPPRGLLLLGVQGCGKSMCAKAIASAWGLPLIRLDPSRLYNKFFGESERNLRRATKTAEAMAPIVLWIDEIEKAFAQSGDQDSGTSTRIFGTLLTWMQDKKASVFVVATSNDVSRLPPELLRKGRFDEIFFVDLPSPEVRKAIFEVHLKRRGRDPASFDLAKLATDSEGFSGAEIEQAVLSALYSAFAQNVEPDTAIIAEEIARTVPLSVTARERIEALRQWASNRTVPAN
jgi:SpoVK/Ycf46/Vps4 family AAA+-type ATPase